MQNAREPILLQPKSAPGRGASPVVIAAVPLTIAFVLWTVLSEGDAEARATPPVAPELFGTELPCPFAGEAAGFQAARDEAAGLARLERYPFDARDGIHAVELLRRAAMCHRAAGVDAAAENARMLALRAQARVERDYRMGRFRLERALANRRTSDALIESGWLLDLAGHRSGDWIDWLRDTQRALRGARGRSGKAS